MLPKIRSAEKALSRGLFGYETAKRENAYEKR